ncbi:unnamed protein product [Lampetra planeri]
MVSAASSRDCSGVSHKSQDGGAPAPAAAASVSSPCGFFLQNSCSAAGCAPRGASEMAAHGRLSAAMFKMAAACHVVAGGRVPADVSPSSEDVTIFLRTPLVSSADQRRLARAPHALPPQLFHSSSHPAGPDKGPASPLGCHARSSRVPRTLFSRAVHAPLACPARSPRVPRTLLSRAPHAPLACHARSSISSSSCAPRTRSPVSSSPVSRSAPPRSAHRWPTVCRRSPISHVADGTAAT